MSECCDFCGFAPPPGWGLVVRGLGTDNALALCPACLNEDLALERADARRRDEEDCRGK